MVIIIAYGAWFVLKKNSYAPVVGEEQT
jgi:hypothetical protein